MATKLCCKALNDIPIVPALIAALDLHVSVLNYGVVLQL